MLVNASVLAVIEALYGFLERSPTGIVLLDGQKRVVFANGRAATLHARADGVSVSASGLALLRSEDNAKLQTLIARALAAGGSSSRSMRAPRSSGRRPYGLVIAPIAGRDSVSTLRPSICIVIADPDDGKHLAAERLREAFDLTEAEDRLAARLAAGEGLRSAAHSLGITYGTARARLAEVFQKTETRRQGELVSLFLNTLAAM